VKHLERKGHPGGYTVATILRRISLNLGDAIKKKSDRGAGGHRDNTGGKPKDPPQHIATERHEQNQMKPTLGIKRTMKEAGVPFHPWECKQGGQIVKWEGWGEAFEAEWAYGSAI